jgi:predicted ATPase
LFDLGYEIKISKFKDEETSELSDVFAIRLIDKYTKVNVSLLDVGFGISQILPVIIQSVSSENKTIVIEQPEIHIHPRLQAQLGSLLAESVKSFGNRFIIETHSEHLLLRLKKLIRKGELTHEDIAVVYVDRGDSGSQCLELRLDSDGDFIDEWPNGFFDESFNEIFG